jgi:CDP-glucose 4,6-dehydratase
MQTVNDIAKEFIFAWGSGKIKFVTPKDSDISEAGLLHLNCDKAHHDLGWYPKWGFKKTVEQTVKWYKAFKEGENAGSITEQQIIEYMEC